VSNPFEKHGIKHLSASSLALYRAEPSIWTMKYLYGVKDEMGAAVWRGSAVEAGVDLMIYNPTATVSEVLPTAYARFDNEAQGEISDKIDKERGGIPGFIEQAASLLRPLGIPTARQWRTDLWLDGIEVPVIGYLDYLWPDFLVDLKTTWALPSTPKPDHAIQVVGYQEATGRKPKLAYVTPKKGALYDIEDPTEPLWSLRRSATALRSMLDRAGDRDAVANMFSPNFDDFRWNDALKQEAFRLYGSL
jgi:hypothetical protein